MCTKISGIWRKAPGKDLECLWTGLDEVYGGVRRVVLFLCMQEYGRMGLNMDGKYEKNQEKSI